MISQCLSAAVASMNEGEKLYGRGVICATRNEENKLGLYFLNPGFDDISSVILNQRTMCDSCLKNKNAN